MGRLTSSKLNNFGFFLLASVCYYIRSISPKRWDKQICLTCLKMRQENLPDLSLGSISWNPKNFGCLKRPETGLFIYKKNCLIFDLAHGFQLIEPRDKSDKFSCLILRQVSQICLSQRLGEIDRVFILALYLFKLIL